MTSTPTKDGTTYSHTRAAVGVEKTAGELWPVLCDAEKPIIRCHPNNEQYAKAIAEQFRDFKVQVIVDEFVQEDTIYAMDDEYFNKQRDDLFSFEKPMSPKKLEYDFSPFNL